MNELTKGLNDIYEAAEHGLKHAKEWAGNKLSKEWEAGDRTVGKDSGYFHTCYKNICEEIMGIVLVSLEAHNKVEPVVYAPQPGTEVTEKKIVDYKIVYCTNEPRRGPDGRIYDSRRTLQQNVCASLETGWELYGAPVQDDGEYLTLVQAMVKYECKDKK